MRLRLPLIYIRKSENVGVNYNLNQTLAQRDQKTLQYLFYFPVDVVSFIFYISRVLNICFFLQPCISVRIHFLFFYLYIYFCNVVLLLILSFRCAHYLNLNPNKDLLKKTQSKGVMVLFLWKTNYTQRQYSQDSHYYRYACQSGYVNALQEQQEPQQRMNVGQQAMMIQKGRGSILGLLFFSELLIRTYKKLLFFLLSIKTWVFAQSFLWDLLFHCLFFKQFDFLALSFLFLSWYTFNRNNCVICLIMEISNNTDF